MTILMVLKGIADGIIKNKTRLKAVTDLCDDLYVYKYKLYYVDEFDNLFELKIDDIIELIEDEIIFILKSADEEY